tara:strand:+ start:1831 stop:2034 length:204 start_codon:yes stop_codon:yes gene_type:complete
MKIFKNYNKPTPAFWRRLGDTLLAVSTMSTAYAIATENTKIAIVVLVVGAIGKFMTNFFSIENDVVQ